MFKKRQDHESIIAQWKTVRVYQSMMKTNTLGAFANGAGQSTRFLDSCHTLVLIFAFAVLERGLRVLQGEGAYPQPRDGQSGFKALMVASRPALPWVDFDLVSEGRDERHKAAHGLKVVPRADSWRYIEAIEREFLAWGVLVSPVEADFVMTIGKAE